MLLARSGGVENSAKGSLILLTCFQFLSAVGVLGCLALVSGVVAPLLFTMAEPPLIGTMLIYYLSDLADLALKML